MRFPIFNSLDGQFSFPSIRKNHPFFTGKVTPIFHYWSVHAPSFLFDNIKQQAEDIFRISSHLQVQYLPHQYCSPLPGAFKCKVHPESRSSHAHIAQEIPQVYGNTLQLMALWPSLRKNLKWGKVHDIAHEPLKICCTEKLAHNNRHANVWLSMIFSI